MRNMVRASLAILMSLIMADVVLAEPEEQISWREQYAYSMGMAAYPYVLPYLYMSQLRWRWTNNPINPENSPYAAINHFWHVNKVVDASYKDGGTPNNDTVYSIAWVYVGDEPVILSHPEMDVRNFSFHFSDYTSDVFTVVSQRATGQGAGHFALAYKDFKGELPEGVQKLEVSPTPWVFLLARTMVYDKQDMPNVTALQKQYQLTPLSYWGKPADALPASHDVWRPYKARQDPLASWRTINRAMTENPPPESERELLSFFGEIVHIGPGQDLDTLDEDSKRGLARAARDAHKLAIQARNDIPGRTIVNGWGRNPGDAGRMTDAGRYFMRGVNQSFKGIAPNYPEEARYFARSRNEDGEYLDGSQATYELTFPVGKLPPVEAFWSVTMYGLDANLVDNSLNRYSIGDRTPGLKQNADGSLTLYVQHQSPGKDKEANWLPAPEARFTMTLRTYRPRDEVTRGGVDTTRFRFIE
jgi:hypothetical protein